MQEILVGLLNIHPAIQVIFSLLVVALVFVVIWCIAIDNAMVVESYDEHARESNWGKP